jgi:small-conductance mechanosensitive channel
MRLPRVARPRLAGAVGVARAQMGPLQWVGLGSAVSTTTNVGQALLTSRPTLASRLWTWLGSEGIARRFGGGALPTFIAEVLLVVATISLVQFLVRLVRHGIALVQAVTKRADMDESAADDDENSVAARGPTGSPRNSLSPPKRSLPVIPLAGLTVAVLGASLLDSAAAVGLLATVPAWVWLVTWLRLGCDMLLEVALAAVALHLLDVLRSRIVSEDGAKLGQKIMSGGPPTAARPRQLDRRASMKEARVNTLVQSLAAAVWVCTVFALLDTAGINYQALLTLGGVSSVLLGFVGRDILSNLMGATVLYATQPFTKGDWIQSIKEASDGRREVDGWVEKIGWCVAAMRVCCRVLPCARARSSACLCRVRARAARPPGRPAARRSPRRAHAQHARIRRYYTVINTWDKRPLHMPNAKLATMEVINASRMTNRRILWQPKIRLADMSVMPQIVSEMREALLANPELDPTQHRFVFLRSVSDFSLDLWISCHTTSVYLEDFLRINQARKAHNTTQRDAKHNQLARATQCAQRSGACTHHTTLARRAQPLSSP